MRKTPAPERLLTTEEVAQLLRVPLRTLYQWRYHHTGPAAIRVGKYLRYLPEAVHGWLASLQEAER